MSSRTPSRSPPSAKKQRSRRIAQAHREKATEAALIREQLGAEYAEQVRQENRARRDAAKANRELKEARRSFQSDTFSAPFGDTTAVGAPVSTTVVGAPVAQTQLDEYGVLDGTDLTVAFNRGRAEPIGSNDTTSQSWRDISSIPGTPSLSIFDSFSIHIDDLAVTPDGPPPGALPYGLTTPTGEPAELDDRDTSPDASTVNLSAAFDAVGDNGAGLRAARGADADGTLHMGIYVAAIQEVQQLMREVSYDEYVQRRVAENRQAGQADSSQRPSNVVGQLETDSDAEPSEEELDSTSQFVVDKRIALKSFDRNDAAAAAFNASLAESESDDEPGGTPDAEPLKQLDVVAKAEAARLLRDSPGILRLLASRVFKFSDFLTNGEFDPQKLAKVRGVLAKRVDSTAESYKLAASARGYTPSGAAYPITGLNNIVAGVRKIPGTKYVLYQGPQYVNG